MEELFLSEAVKAVDGIIEYHPHSIGCNEADDCNHLSTDVKIQGICLDSRRIKEGELFIAITGENFNGHDFINEVIDKGCSAVIASFDYVRDNPSLYVKDPSKYANHPSVYEKDPSGYLNDPSGYVKDTSNKNVRHYGNTFCIGVPMILVKDTLKALWQLAAYYRSRFNIPVIAVTGSVGKTSTKDMIAGVLSIKYKVHKTSGNYNNHIGLPLTIFGLEKQHDILVVEMGMRGIGEIQALSEIAKPSVAIITNIGISHIERLGSRENILKAKLEILYCMEGKGTLIVNLDNDLLRKFSQENNKAAYNIIGIGKLEQEPGSSITGGNPENNTHTLQNGIFETDINPKNNSHIPQNRIFAFDLVDKGENGVQFKVDLNEKIYTFRIGLPGVHNVYNALFSIACGLITGLEPDEIIKGIENYNPEDRRLKIINKNGVKFINDTYNASPDSYKSALQVLAGIRNVNGKCIAVIGNMFELGDKSPDAHFEVGRIVGELGIPYVAVIGENAEDVIKGMFSVVNPSGINTECNPPSYMIFETHEEVADYLQGILSENDVVLIKGSRGMKMERILDILGII